MCSRHLPSGCIQMIDIATGQRLPNVTALEADLFNQQLELRSNSDKPECLVDLDTKVGLSENADLVEL